MKMDYITIGVAAFNALVASQVPGLTAAIPATLAIALPVLWFGFGIRQEFRRVWK